MFFFSVLVECGVSGVRGCRSEWRIGNRGGLAKDLWGCAKPDPPVCNFLGQR